MIYSSNFSKIGGKVKEEFANNQTQSFSYPSDTESDSESKQRHYFYLPADRVMHAQCETVRCALRIPSNS